MKIQKVLFYFVVVLTLGLSACTPAAAGQTLNSTPTAAMMEKPTDTMMEKPADAMMEKPTDTMMEKPADTMMEKPADTMMEKTPVPGAMLDKPTAEALMAAPAWFSTQLTNVSLAQIFTINDFKGKVVLVETMAQWCPSCKKQQQEVKSMLSQLGMPADLVAIALDIDANENPSTLKAYAASNGFGWIYAVAPAGVSGEIGNLYGSQFLNPPSTPILIIDRKGQAHPLPFGIKSAADLIKALEPYLKGM